MTILRKCTLAAVVMIALLTSCQTNDPANFFTRDYTVTSSDWKMEKNDDASGMYYYCEFKEPNLTQNVYDNGVMQAFLYTKNGNISPLPFNDYWINNSTGYMSTEQITCEFVPGYITFIVKASDHDENFPPSYDEYDFRVRFTW